MTSQIADQIAKIATEVVGTITGEVPSSRSNLFYLSLSGAYITDGETIDFAEIRTEEYRILQAAGHAFFCAALLDKNDVDVHLVETSIEALISHLETSNYKSPALALLRKSLEIINQEFEPGQSTLMLADEIEHIAGELYQKAIIELLQSRGLGTNELDWGNFVRRSYVFIEATQSAKKGEVAASVLGKVNETNWLPGDKLFFIPPHSGDIFGVLFRELLGSRSTGRPYGRIPDFERKPLPEITLMGIKDPKLQAILDNIESEFQIILEEGIRAEFDRIINEGSAVIIDEQSIVILQNGQRKEVSRPEVSPEGLVLMAYDICRDLAYRLDLKHKGRQQIGKSLNLNALYGLGGDDLVLKLKEFIHEYMEGHLNYKPSRMARFEELTKEEYQKLLAKYKKLESDYLRSVIPDCLPPDTYVAVNAPQASQKAHPILSIHAEKNVVFCPIFTNCHEALSNIARMSFVHKIMASLLAKGEGDITAVDSQRLDHWIRGRRDDTELRNDVL